MMVVTSREVSMPKKVVNFLVPRWRTTAASNPLKPKNGRGEIA